MTDTERAERNKNLCQDYEDWHDSELPKTESLEAFKIRLGAKYDLSERHVYQILRDTRTLIPINKEYEKRKRIDWLKRNIAKKGDRTNKDTSDLMEQLRKELEGDKAQIENHIHNIAVNVKEIDGKNIDARFRASQQSV